MKRLLFAPLLLTLLVGCSSKDKTLIERRDACADYVSSKIDRKEMIKAMGLNKEPENFDRRVTYWCAIYGLENWNK